MRSVHDGGGRAKRRRIDQAERPAGDQLSIANDAFDDVVDQSLDDELFAVEEGNDGIRRVLDRFDEVSVHDKLRAVQARHIDHKTSSPLGVSPGFCDSYDPGPPGHGSLVAFRATRGPDAPGLFVSGYATNLSTTWISRCPRS